MRHSLPNSAHSENAQDFAADLPAQQHIRSQGTPRVRSDEFLRLEGAARSAQQKQYGNIGCRLVVDAWCVCERNLPLCRALQIDVLVSNRISSDDFYCWRAFLEKNGIQAVAWSYEHCVGSLCCREELLSCEGSWIRVSSRLEFPIDAVFHFFRKLARDHQNWFLHVRFSDFRILNSNCCKRSGRSSPELPFGAA